jgi:clumping factor B
MMGLVTTMAEESQYFRNKINTLQSKLSPDSVDESTLGGTKHIELIAVSDDEDDSDSDSDSDSDNDSEVSDSDSDSDSDNDSEVSDSDSEVSISDADEKNIDKNDIKIINIPLDIITHNISDIDVEDFNDNLVEDNTFLKTNVNLNGDLEITGDNHKTDYKKLTINKLKEIVVSKGITNDVSKLKKNDLLKLLEDE